MKKKFILLPVICALSYVILSGYASGPASSIGLDGTGASGTATCNTGGCHTPTSGTSIVTTVQLINASTMAVATTYTPGGSYFIRVSASNTSSSATASLPRFGFQVSAVKTSTTTNAGTLSAITGTHTATGGSINLVEHSSPLTPTTGTGGPGTIYSRDIPWTAPVAGTGSVTLRGIINAVNFNGSTTGDIFNASSATVTEASSTGTAPITGTLTVCTGAYTTLSDATAGGTWSSSTTSVATVTGTGVVHGLSAGTTTISYAAGSGTVTAVVTVNPSPAAITGVPVVCPGGVTTLADATSGGTWSSSTTTVATVSAAGVVTGVTSGSTIITYALSTGCNDTAALTVSTVPPITGTGTMCIGATTTLAHIVPGGSWSTSTPSVATVVSTSGVVTGVAAGTATISYSFGTSGCYATTVVTVIGAPSITGSSSVCVAHTITLTGNPAGGTWTSSNTTKATVGATTGIVTGVATGTLTIKYKVTTACGTDSTTKAMTVTPATPCVSAVYNPFATTDEIKLFPNPNRGSFSLNVLATVDEEAHIVVTNIVGAKVREFDIKTNEVNNITLDQPAGTYFLSATTLSSKYFVKVVVE